MSILSLNNIFFPNVIFYIADKAVRTIEKRRMGAASESSHLTTLHSMSILSLNNIFFPNIISNTVDKTIRTMEKRRMDATSESSHLTTLHSWRN